MSDSKDKDFVVVENGQRASGLQSQESAQQDAAERKRLNEAQGDQAPTVEVKQNLFG